MFAALALSLAVTLGSTAPFTDGPTTGADDDGFIVEVEEYTNGVGVNTPERDTSGVTYQWEPACPEDRQSSSGYHTACVRLFECAPDRVPWVLTATGVTDSPPIRSECRGGASPSPTITPAAVATAFRRVPLPSLHSVAQPGDKTLVNFDTIFHVEAATLDREIRLLGQRVELMIAPTRFLWTFGDGTELVSTTPGAAYPAKTLVHRYQRADVTVRHQVEVTWTATYRVNGGPWQDVPGQVTIDGPGTTLRVAEAVPLLSDPERDER